ncbi:uncharacterized protein LOC109708858 isoform X1 [Ananas comosus]|uniref:Uncharacterized protein LOC109708858 isoform X1 n=1 Tax=Ananas comosus TaxID=4615 RepID=A0A6P5ES39_ANACO|nr:uncharacterized protein LOC109708858 isoform X1 [Ananas comosus]
MSGSGANHRMLVLGTGFVGRYASERLIEHDDEEDEVGWQVSGTCTSAAKKRELEKIGIDAFIFDATKSKMTDLHTLKHATHLLISIPTIAGIGDPLLFSYEDLRNTLSHGNLRWLCYLSSTSVYGDCGGALVDEDYPANPKSESAKLRLAAEKGWSQLGSELGLSVYIFRLGGIYGPGRSALDTMVKRKSLSKGQKLRESRQYTARVHVADIYQAIKASFKVPSSGRIYNVVDDDPASRAEVFAFARNLLEHRFPDMAKEFGDVSLPDLASTEKKMHGEKRVSNARLKNELGVRLLYPTYRSGLQSIFDSWSVDNY